MRRKSSIVISLVSASGLAPVRESMPPHQTAPYIVAQKCPDDVPGCKLVRCFHCSGAGEPMDRAFTSIGIIALVGAVGWWHAFYGQVHQLLGATGPLPIECLYSMSSA